MRDAHRPSDRARRGTSERHSRVDPKRDRGREKGREGKKEKESEREEREREQGWDPGERGSRLFIQKAAAVRVHRHPGTMRAARNTERSPLLAHRRDTAARNNNSSARVRRRWKVSAKQTAGVLGATVALTGLVATAVLSSLRGERATPSSAPPRQDVKGAKSTSGLERTNAAPPPAPAAAPGSREHRDRGEESLWSVCACVYCVLFVDSYILRAALAIVAAVVATTGGAQLSSLLLCC